MSRRRIYKREEWGALPPKVTYPVSSEPAERVVFSYGINTLPCRTFTECKHILQKLQKNHFRQGMSDIAYNFLIGGDGNAYEGRGWLNDSSTRLRYAPGKRVDIAFIGRHNKTSLPMGMLHHATDLVATGQRKGYIKQGYQLEEIVTKTKYRNSKIQRTTKGMDITNQAWNSRLKNVIEEEDRFWESPYFNEILPPGVPPPLPYGIVRSETLDVKPLKKDIKDSLSSDDEEHQRKDLDQLKVKEKNSSSVNSIQNFGDQDDNNMDDVDSDDIVFDDDSDKFGSDTDFDPDKALKDYFGEGDVKVLDSFNSDDLSTDDYSNFKGKNKGKKNRCSGYETVFDNSHPDIDLTEAYRASLSQKSADNNVIGTKEKVDRAPYMTDDGTSKQTVKKRKKPKNKLKKKVQSEVESVSDVDSDEVLTFDNVPPKSKEWLERKGLTKDVNRLKYIIEGHKTVNKMIKEYKAKKKADDIIFTDEDEQKKKNKPKATSKYDNFWPSLNYKRDKKLAAVAKEEEEFLEKTSRIKQIRGSFVKIPIKNKLSWKLTGKQDHKRRERKKARERKEYDPSL